MNPGDRVRLLDTPLNGKFAGQAGMVVNDYVPAAGMVRVLMSDGRTRSVRVDCLQLIAPNQLPGDRVPD
jgi:hypothetical protein